MTYWENRTKNFKKKSKKKRGN